MNSYQPIATHVAIRDGRVLGTGDLESVASFGEYQLDTRFEDKVLMPGFVEGHCHAMEGGVWKHIYVGYQDRYDPDGKLWKGADSLQAVIDLLVEMEGQMEDPDQPLFAWGFDPIYFGEDRMSTRHVDQISTTRMILILHSNGHLLNVNSKVLAAAGIDADCSVHGVLKDTNGQPTGELMEMAAHYMAYKVAGSPFLKGIDVESLLGFGKSAVNCGVTMATDLFATFSDTNMAAYIEATAKDNYPLRILPAMNTLDMPPADGIAAVIAAKKHNTEKLHFGLCKVMTDGSIQGFTGRMKWPGYLNGAPNGVWNMAPEQLSDLVGEYHRAGMHLHIHTNGDEASELMIDALEKALKEAPDADHRHTLQHCQMADESQFRRMAKLGICANLFSNHIYYWGDQHRAITLGPDRASRMDACNTAQRQGVHYAIHSDAPVTPLAPLFTAWCAVNRLTESGVVLGENERIPVERALYAITLGAAYTIKMDHLAGSIEPGKYADFAVLEDDPHSVEPGKLKDIGVWGTVVGGVATQAAARDARA
ncbi:amidohydrolase [Chromatiales bacterium (ex Bugula neritina AB1)]|nr:amidohydrolase [Chromatiales bacterium (ex Bugula neritina AB1)]